MSKTRNLTFREIHDKWRSRYRCCPVCGMITHNPLFADGPRADCTSPICYWSVNVITDEVLSKAAVDDERNARSVDDAGGEK